MSDYFGEDQKVEEQKIVTMPKDEYDRMCEVMEKMYFKLLEHEKTHEAADTGKLSKFMDYMGM